MEAITLYSAGGCGYCNAAENLLRRKGVNHWQKIAVDRDPDMLETMVRLTGRHTVPQIFIGVIHVGGFDDLIALDREGKLDALLSALDQIRPR
ncbi:MAG: glutaredoxin 3 [Betaproteobacteria bacterium HGW-Betaproteobacteria-16]|nr:MAG: glutaredoxin 3 [Betaproteobacteria bacterium HGW-Betaproteobacteria-16]